MTGFGANPTTGSQGALSANQIPVSSVAVPGHANGDLTALEGGPESTDGNGNKTAPASVYIKDGNDVTMGTQADAAWGGSGSASQIAILKKLVAQLNAALTVSGTVSVNALPAGSNVIGNVELVDSGGTNKASITAGGSLHTTVDNGNANGQATMVNSSPVVLASDHTDIKVKGDFTEVAGVTTISASTGAGGSATVAAADFFVQQDVSAYKWFSVQLAGTWSATFTFQGSNDNTNWQVLYVNSIGIAGTFGTTTTGNGIYYAPISFRYLRVRCTAFTSNSSLSGNIELYTSMAGIIQVAATQAGTWTVQPGNTANTTAWKVDGSAVIQPVSGTVTATNPSVGTDGSAIPTSSTLLGASDGTNLQQLLVESASNRNLRAGIYSGANEATVTGANALKVDNSAVTQPVSGSVTANAGTNLNTSLLALESGGNLAAAKTDLDTIVTNTNKIPASSVSATLQSAQAGNANGSTLNVLGMGSANITVNMSGFSGSVTFEGSGDGTNFQSISVNQQGTSAFSTSVSGATTTSIVLYTCSVASLQLLRARTSSVTAGTVTVTAEAVPAPWTYSNNTTIATQGTSPWTTSLIDGVGGVNLASVDGSNRLKTIVSSALPAGANTIGNVGIVAGSAVIGSATIQATSGTALSADQSNTELRTSLYGKNSAAGDTALKVNSSGDVYTLGDFTEQASLSAGSLNADLVASTDVSAYKWFSLQVAGVWSGQLQFSGSNDNVNFQPTYVQAIGATGPTNNPTTNNIYSGPVVFRYLRIRMTSYTSGTATGTLELYTSPTAWNAMWANQTGTWTFNAAVATSGGSSDYHLISAATTNANNIKASAGQVYGYDIYNSNAAARYVKLYNKASAPTVGTDTPFRTIGVPPSGRASFHSSVGLVMGTGISIATTTGIADTDNTAVGLSDLSIDIDYK